MDVAALFVETGGAYFGVPGVDPWDEQKAPSSLDPLPDGWTWDTEEPDNPWLWCPHWHLPKGCATADKETE